MDSITLSTTLRESARSNGLCDEWYKEWEDDTSEERLAEKMYRGLDFVLKHHWPENNFIKDNFTLDFRRKVNVFVDDKYSIINPKHSLILGTSDITIRYNAKGKGNIHVRDNASVKLTAKTFSFVIVHLYENAYVEAEQFDYAKIVLIKHSPDVVIVGEENLTVKEEYDYLK